MTVITIGEMPGMESEEKERRHLYEADVAQNQRGMGVKIEVPTCGHEQHLETECGKRRSRKEQPEAAGTKGCVGIQGTYLLSDIFADRVCDILEPGRQNMASGAKGIKQSGIKESLRGRGFRMTRQRQILLDLIDKSGEHLDADHLYQRAKEQDPKLNRVTVYRTLKMLKNDGLVDELDLMHHAGEQHYYETRMKQEHAHVVCLHCGRVEEYFGTPLQKMRREISSSFGFQILVARTEVGGYCAECQAARAREMQTAAEPALVQKPKSNALKRRAQAL